jgi:hypothetical protein
MGFSSNLFLLVISSIFLEPTNQLPSITMECHFDHIPNSSIRRAHHKCEIIDFSLPIEVETFDFNYTGTYHEKETVKSLQFTLFDKVEFIPYNTATEFPNLEALEIVSSNLTAIGNKLFQWELWRLKCLNLSLNQIEKIEEKAFWELTNLEIVDLSYNLIEDVIDKIFVRNLKLRIVSFHGNRIKMIIPRLFQGLNDLKFVDFYSNEIQCVHERFRSSDGSISLINRGLQQCQENCYRHIQCVFNIWKSEPQLLSPEMRRMLKFI